MREINELLRDAVMDVIEEYSGITGIRTKIARMMIGTNSQSLLHSWLNNTNNTNLGFKPISRIAESFGYDVKVVFVNRDDKEVMEGIDELNKSFVNFMKEVLSNRLQKYRDESYNKSKNENDKNIISKIEKIEELFMENEEYANMVKSY